MSGLVKLRTELAEEFKSNRKPEVLGLTQCLEQLIGGQLYLTKLF